MTTNTCNCENSDCLTCEGKGCQLAAGTKKAMYIGYLCDGCARSMPKEYMLPEVK